MMKNEVRIRECVIDREFSQNDEENMKRKYDINVPSLSTVRF